MRQTYLENGNGQFKYLTGYTGSEVWIYPSGGKLTSHRRLEVGQSAGYLLFRTFFTSLAMGSRQFGF
ncbi:MAG: hypothetical protein MK324_03765 [Pirellulales bacterium]|nr:hypothetical protein [Pirellulales bacterium]